MIKLESMNVVVVNAVADITRKVGGALRKSGRSTRAKGEGASGRTERSERGKEGGWTRRGRSPCEGSLNFIII